MSNTSGRSRGSPPLIRQLRRARTQWARKSIIGFVIARSVTRSSAFSRGAAPEGGTRPRGPGPGPAGSYVAPWRFPAALKINAAPVSRIEDADEGIDAEALDHVLLSGPPGLGGR